MRTMLNVVVVILLVSSAYSQDYQGASAILSDMAKASKTKPVEEKANPVEELRLKIETLRKEAPTLPPGDAANQWLKLLEAYLTIPSEELHSVRAYEDRLSLSNIITSLPPPAAWDDIAKLLTARKTPSPLQDAALQLLAAVLLGDESARENSFKTLQQSLSQKKDLEDYERQHYEDYLDRLSESIQSLAGSDADRVDAVEKRITLLEKDDEKTIERYGKSLEVPDLIRFADREKATELLTRALKLDLEAISIEGRATEDLAAELALKHVDDLQTPLWQLVSTLDHAELYEALRKKFPDANDWTRQTAAQIYLLSLIASDRTEEAVTMVQEEQENAKKDDHLRIQVHGLNEMKRQGLGGKVLAFLRSLLVIDPAMPYWEEFVELSAQQNAATDALSLLEESLAKASITDATRAVIQSQRYLALLAADQREEGIKILRELVKTEAMPRSGGDDAQAQEMRKRWEQVGVHVSPEMMERFQQQASNQDDNGKREQVRLAAKLAKIGRLLDRPELIEEAVTAVTALTESLPVEGSQRESIVHAVVELLLDHGRGPAAETLLKSHLAQLVIPNDKQRRQRSPVESLCLLIGVYDQAGRHADVLTLLEKSPNWGAPDLAAFETNNANDTPLLIVVGRALAAAGRQDEAQRVVRRAIQDYPHHDSAYELLLLVGADQPLPTLLDELARRDRFEERPLIWKAKVLLEDGDLAEAERTIRAAIAIDPSDGEQGKGDRMRAYAVLADVLDKRGDSPTAEIMRGAVRAIRKSEDADDWWSAGLLGEAVKRYEAALLDFADAYCIQSRLALRYSELGQLDKAEKHYLRAFELMPESFGRVESHCFGCEHAFAGSTAQNVADQVFSRLASEPPVRAQVHYLLGYLREAQSRENEAAEAYRKAVKTDPEYLNAWKELASLAETTQMPRSESDSIALQIFRLDPPGRHSSPNLSQLSDLRALWTTLLEAEKSIPEVQTGPILALPASQDLIEKQQEAGGNNAWNTWSYPSLFSRRNETRNHFIENPLVRAVAEFIEMVSRN